jgi:hypothetical protein
VINEDRAEKAVEWIRDNAPKLGQARGRMAAADASMRRTKALEMMAARELSDKKRTESELESMAYCSPAYADAIEELSNATAEYETQRAMFQAAELTVEVWRSQNSAARRGHV